MESILYSVISSKKWDFKWDDYTLDDVNRLRNIPRKKIQCLVWRHSIDENGKKYLWGYIEFKIPMTIMQTFWELDSYTVRSENIATVSLQCISVNQNIHSRAICQQLTTTLRIFDHVLFIS